MDVRYDEYRFDCTNEGIHPPFILGAVFELWQHAWVSDVHAPWMSSLPVPGACKELVHARIFNV